MDREDGQAYHLRIAERRTLAGPNRTCSGQSPRGAFRTATGPRETPSHPKGRACCAPAGQARSGQQGVATSSHRLAAKTAVSATHLMRQELAEPAEQGGQEPAMPADHLREEGRPGALPVGVTSHTLGCRCPSRPQNLQGTAGGGGGPTCLEG